mgnify:FL=1|tara:strand:- start:181 stop:489 length:309 start_codon:yes stop_codon:yes gene_type:complete
MQNLPLEIVNNILIIQYEEQLKEKIKETETLEKKLKSLEFNLRDLQHNADNMLHYLETMRVPSCEECDIYGNDDEIILYPEFEEYLCEECEQFRQDQKAVNS